MQFLSTFQLILCIFCLPYTFGVKIGVSKLSTTTTTTTTTTLAPKFFEETTSTPELVENISTLETTTITTTTSIKPTTAEQEFPPKITKSSKKQTTTAKPSASTTTLESTTAASTSKQNPSNVENSSLLYKFQSNENHLYCACNLMSSICDINCCCDPDCTKDILKVFNCFLPSKYPELRVRLEDFQYEHGLPSCKINDGWLCVFRTNTHPPATKVIPYSFNTANSFKWPSSLRETDDFEQHTVRDFYKFGDPILLLNKKNFEIRNFELPYAFKPPFCKLKEPIRHLMPVERHCKVSSLSKAKNMERELRFIIETNKLLKRPKNPTTDVEDLKDNHVLNFQVKTHFKKLENQIEASTELNIYSNETENEDLTQTFLIEEVNIKIKHNFTDLLHCLIEIKLNEIVSDNENQDPMELWQKYSIKFVAANATDKYLSTEVKNIANEFTFSGPLGYLQGEPLIIAKFVAQNDSEEINAQNRVLDFFKKPPSTKENTLRVFARKNSYCQRSEEKFFSLNYGVSSLHQCNFEMPTDSWTAKYINKNLNGTEICLKLQQQILQQLFERTSFEELTEIFVSMLGHPQNATEKWLPMEVENVDFAPVVGQQIDKSPNITCRNILLSAAYEFHIGTFTEHGIPHQGLVKHSVLKLGQRHDLEFSLEEHFEVPLTLTVMFYDLALNTGSLNVHIRSVWQIATFVIVCLQFCC